MSGDDGGIIIPLRDCCETDLVKLVERVHIAGGVVEQLRCHPDDFASVEERWDEALSFMGEDCEITVQAYGLMPRGYVTTWPWPDKEGT